MFTHSYLHTTRKRLLVLSHAFALLAAGCATTPQKPSDPWSAAVINKRVTQAGSADVAIQAEKNAQKNIFAKLSPDGARLLLKASSPVTQSALRWVALETILRTSPADWNMGWTAEAIQMSDLAADPTLLELLATHETVRTYLKKTPDLLPAFVASYATLVAEPDRSLLAGLLDAWHDSADAPWARYLVQPATQKLVASPRRKGSVGLALPFSGASASAGWRLGFAYLAGWEHHSAIRRPVHFLDTERALTESLVASETGPSDLGWVVGPFRKQAVQNWSPLLAALELASVGFSPRTGPEDTQPPIRLAQNHAHNARELARQLVQKLGIRTISLFAPANSAGDTFVRAFAAAIQTCEECSLTGISWYTEDLHDLTVRARMHYGADRYTDAWLEENEKERTDVDGVLQAEVTVVQATADNLQRVLGELIYFGSTFQMFAGDYNFGAVKQLESLRLRAPLLFVDHYYRPDALQAQQGPLQQFERAVARSTFNKPILPDLLMYEAGELTARDAFRTKESVSGAAGVLAPDTDGSWQLPLYPLMVSDRVVIPADFNILKRARDDQERRKHNFLKRQAELAEMKANKEADKEN